MLDAKKCQPDCNQLINSFKICCMLSIILNPLSKANETATAIFSFPLKASCTQHNKQIPTTTATAHQKQQQQQKITCNKNGTHRLIFKRPILFLWPNNKIPDARQKSGVVWVIVVPIGTIVRIYTTCIYAYGWNAIARAWPQLCDFFSSFHLALRRSACIAWIFTPRFAPKATARASAYLC